MRIYLTPPAGGQGITVPSETSAKRLERKGWKRTEAAAAVTRDEPQPEAAEWPTVTPADEAPAIDEPATDNQTEDS